MSIFSAGAGNIFGGATLNLLTAAKRFSAPGIGLSQRAKVFNDEYLNKLNSTANGLFSSTVSATQSIEGLQTQILALRSGKSEAQLAPSLRGNNVDTDA